MDQLNYQQASRIRGESIASLFADQLIAGKGYKEGIKNVISLKSKATAKGIKEKFDPLSIAKTLTGGSRLGPAIMGKILGRSKKDIEYFAGRAMPIFEKITKLSTMDSEDEIGEKTKPGKKDNLTGVKTILNKILTFLNKSYEREVRLREKENNFKEEYKLEDDKRHNQLLKVLAGISSGNEEKTTKKTDFFKSFTDDMKSKLFGKIKTTTTNKVEEKVVQQAGKTAGTSLTTSAEKSAASTAAAAVIPPASTAAATQVTEEVVKKSTSEIIKKEAGVALTKAAPFVGMLVNTGVAASRAADGDWNGAGISLVQGALTTIPYVFVNPVTGGLVPATVAAATSGYVALTAYDIARSVYKEIYGKFPEQEEDDDVRKQNMNFILNIVKSMVGSNMNYIEKNDPKLEPIKTPEVNIDTLGKTISSADTKTNTAQVKTNTAASTAKPISTASLPQTQTTSSPMAMANSDEKTVPVQTTYNQTTSTIPDVPANQIGVNKVIENYLKSQTVNNELQLSNLTNPTIINKPKDTVVQQSTPSNFEPIDLASIPVRNSYSVINNSLNKQTVVV